MSITQEKLMYQIIYKRKTKRQCVRAREIDLSFNQRKFKTIDSDIKYQSQIHIEQKAGILPQGESHNAYIHK